MLLTLAMCGQLHAQFTTTFAKNITPGQQNGLYYSLPQTMLKLDFIIEEAQLVKGPLSDYASNYMAMEDYDNNGMPEIYLVRARCTIHSDGKIKDLAVGHYKACFIQLTQTGDRRHNGHRTGAEKKVCSAVGLAVGLDLEAFAVFA